MRPIIRAALMRPSCENDVASASHAMRPCTAEIADTSLKHLHTNADHLASTGAGVVRLTAVQQETRAQCTQLSQETLYFCSPAGRCEAPSLQHQCLLHIMATSSERGDLEPRREMTSQVMSSACLRNPATQPSSRHGAVAPCNRS